MRKEWGLETSDGDSWADKNEALGQLSPKLIPTVLVTPWTVACRGFPVDLSKPNRPSVSCPVWTSPLCPNKK